LRVRVEGGRLVELVAPPPVGAKAVRRPTGFEVTLVGTAASLLEGDRLAARVSLGPGECVRVRSVGAQLAFPCPRGGSTLAVLDVELAEGARLWWQPEPVVACAGSRHRSEVSARLAPTASAVLVEELVLGRSGEPAGEASVRTTTAVDVGGRPLWRDGLDTTLPGWSGPAVAGDARYLATVLLAGAPTVGAEGWPAGGHDAARRGLGAPAMALAGPGAVARWLDADPARGRAACERWLAAAAQRPSTNSALPPQNAAAPSSGTAPAFRR
jgi:urease accessory protein